MGNSIYIPSSCCRWRNMFHSKFISHYINRPIKKKKTKTQKHFLWDPAPEKARWDTRYRGRARPKGVRITCLWPYSPDGNWEKWREDVDVNIKIEEDLDWSIKKHRILGYIIYLSKLVEIRMSPTCASKQRKL